MLSDGQFWDFTSDLAKGDTAYTTMALGAHTDTTYFVRAFIFDAESLLQSLQTDPCGLQLFHLLSHTNGSGGASLLVDGFYVASTIKELHPEEYSILSQVPVPAHAAGEPTALFRPNPETGYPVLRHDPTTSQLIQVRWNNDDRSVMSHLEPDLVDKWFLVSPSLEHSNSNITLQVPRNSGME
jgi:trimethyllysine dioxygenase